MADELEDNFVLSDDDSLDVGSDAVAIEDVDGDGAIVAGIVSEDEEAAYAQHDDASPSNKQQKQLSEAESKENRKRKRKVKEKAKKQQRAALAAELSEGAGSVATQPPDMQADYLSSRQRATFSKMSSIELEEVRINERDLLDSTSFGQPRKEENLGSFVRKYFPETIKALSDASNPLNTKAGCPGLIVLTGNAQRAADLAKALRPLNPRPIVDEAHDAKILPKKKKQKFAAGVAPPKERKAPGSASSASSKHANFTVGKLFARHFKLKEHQAWLREHICPLAAGTPQRVAALIASDDLNLDSLDAIIVDQTWVDAKQRTVLDTPETRDELVKLLASEKVIAGLRRAKRPVKLALF